MCLYSSHTVCLRGACVRVCCLKPDRAWMMYGLHFIQKWKWRKGKGRRVKWGSMNSYVWTGTHSILMADKASWLLCVCLLGIWANCELHLRGAGVLTSDYSIVYYAELRSQWLPSYSAKYNLPERSSSSHSKLYMHKDSRKSSDVEIWKCPCRWCDKGSMMLAV